MVKIKKQLRIQPEPVSKKGKIKPAVVIVWDGIQDPLPLIQRRLKTVRSLRNNKTDEEYTIERLRSLADKELILGSTKESKLSAACIDKCVPVVPIKIEEAQVELIPSKLECGLVLSKRARDRMYEQKISKEALERCFHEGEQEKQNEVTIFRCADTVMVVTAKNMVVTINDTTTMASYPFPSDQAMTMKMSKTLRIPSQNDTCGRIIGKRGVTINEIKKICNIERNLTVEWDEDEKEIVLTSLLLLSKSTIDKLKICVDSVIHGRSLSSLESIKYSDQLQQFVRKKNQEKRKK